MLMLCTGLLAQSGCRQELDTTYGNRSGIGKKSVNGTAVLARMFEQAGHKVRSWHVLSPSLENADVIVWAPDDFDLPPEEVRLWFDDWLRQSVGEKSLIYIGRDYSDEINYWTYVRDVAPAAQESEVARRLADARSDVDDRRSNLPQSAEWPEWFSIDGSTKQETVRELRGPWAEGIDAAAVEIEHHGRIIPDGDADVLLAAGDNSPLVSEVVFEWEPGTFVSDDDDMEWRAGWPDATEDLELHPSRLVVVENGSFLLNRPLVNHEHRKLAARLIEHIGPPRKHVVFLQSSSGGPPVRETDPTNQPPSGLAMFTVWPISGVLVHVAALGVVFALSRWPIFGIPRRLEAPSLTDFGTHVRALGKLLQREGDAPHALTLLGNYRNRLLGESAADATSDSSPASAPDTPLGADVRGDQGML
jgi:hypothetical protein